MYICILLCGFYMYSVHVDVYNYYVHVSVCLKQCLQGKINMSSVKEEDNGIGSKFSNYPTK